MELDEKEAFDGAVFGERRFPFAQLTVSGSAKIVRRLLTTRNPIVFFYRGLKNIFSRSTIKKRWWIKVRSVAFEHHGLWRLGVVPKELRCSVITQKKAEEIEDSFFDFAEEILKEYKELSLLSNPSQTVNNKVKSEG
jgi:hypothetical protein